MPSNYVPGEGSSSAKLAIVGEAPGGYENDARRPFVGPTGKIVTDILAENGLYRNDVYLTNVVKHQPPGNDISKLSLIGRKVEEYLPQLWSELDSLKPNCILALGNTALTALTGEKGIEHFRGSILRAENGSKVVASLHPASILHADSEGGMKSWKDLTYIKWDFQRAIKESLTPEIDLPQRNLLIARSALDFYRFLDRYQKGEFVSVDIETFSTIPICIGFAFNSVEAISVPLFAQKDVPITKTDLVSIWRDVADLLANPRIKKIGQNFKFDELQLLRNLNLTNFFGLKVNSFHHDTLLSFRTLYPELSGKLEFITSVMTREPYYKEEGKGFNPKKDKFDRLLLYNAKDAVVTYECFERISEELDQRNLTEFFYKKIMPIHAFYSRLERRGIKRDRVRQKFLLEKYESILDEQQKELNELAETNLNVNSPKQIANFLYGYLKLPARKGVDEQTLDALSRNTVRDPKHKRILELILSIRKVRKTIGTYVDAKPHFDGRLRTGYRLILETGRTSTGILKPPVTTEKMGLAFQTITKHGDVGSDIRSMFVPDDGYIFVEPDLSQAEARVVAVLAEDLRIQKFFRYKVDIHSVTAAWIFDREINLDAFINSEDDEFCKTEAKRINTFLKEQILDTIEYSERQIGKMFRHACNLGIGKRMAGAQMGISEYRAGKIIDKVHATNPNIRAVFHSGIEKCLQNSPSRELTAPSGRKRQFLNKWGSELFKEAYAFIPQCTVSDHLKESMIMIEKRCAFSEFLAESHDSFLAQIPLLKGEMYPFRLLDEFRDVTVEILERGIDFEKSSLGSGELKIPCDIKVGRTNWEEMEKLA